MRAIVAIISILFGVPSLAQDGRSAVDQPNVALPPSSSAVPTPNPGAIIIYRGSSVVGAALGCPIRYKGHEIVELGRGKFAEWSVPAGRYILVNGTSSVEVSVAAGETRYVRCQIKTGFLTGRADLQIVDEEDFAKHRADYEKKEVSSPL